MDLHQAKAIYEEMFGKAPPVEPLRAAEPIAPGDSLSPDALAHYAEIIRSALGGLQSELERRRELAERVLGRPLEDPS